VLAQTVVAVDHISEGRLIPGIGAGEAANTIPFGIAMERPVPRLEEYVRLMKMYWTGEPVTFQGEFFDVRDGVVQPTPLQRPYPPVWVAASAPSSLRVVGRVGDGWLPAAKSPEMYREDLAVIRAEAARVGRDPAAITPGLFTYTVLSEDLEYCRRAVADFGRNVLVWWRSSLRRLGVQAGSGDLSIVNFDCTPEATENWRTAATQIPLEVAAQLMAFGTPEMVAERLRAFIAAGVAHFCIIALDTLNDVERWKETTRLLRERVMPLLAAR
jgi:alkanesulfonate monooxygenase SsuD/methylene tetrahydromethanopterin reductase-like flavin-dependent oxidoreductase (luciferase family)